MKEDCDVKPCEIKLESELIIEDDFDVNYFPGPCQEANSQVPHLDLLNLQPVVLQERLDLSLLNSASSTMNPSSMNCATPGFTIQIKEENTEDEDPLAGTCQEANSQVLDTDLLKFQPVVVLERLDLSLLNGVSSTINAPNMNGAVPELTKQIKEENTEDEDPLGGATPSVEWQIPSKTKPSDFFEEESPIALGDFRIKLENDLSKENNGTKGMQILISEFGHTEGTNDSVPKNCGTKNTPRSLGIKTYETSHTTFEIGPNFQDQTLPKALNTNYHIDKLSSPDSGQGPLQREHHPAPISDKVQPRAKLHSGEKRLSCKHCPAQFNRKGNLNRHLRIHSGEKPFSCKQCPAQFKQKIHLTTHLLIHSGEKPFSCKLCPAQYRHKSNLIYHVRVHSGEKPFSCKHCPARFNQKGHLTTHLHVHSGKKSLSCEHCLSQFNQKGSLIKHLRIHSGEKSISC